MEQQDSLKMELQNLSRIQNEQTQILRDMAESQNIDRALKQMDMRGPDPQFTNASMYSFNSAPYGNGAGATFYPSVQPSLISDYARNMNANFAGTMQQLGNNANDGYGFARVFMPHTQSSLMNRDLANMTYGSKISQATIAGAGAGLSTAASFGLGSMLPGLSGLGVSLGAGALVGLYADASIEEVKKNSALKKYIYQNSNRFINSFESTNDRGLSGFSRQQSANAADFVRKLNDDFYMKDEEMMSLLQKYTEGGLLKDATDLDSFKDRMKTLTKTVKEGALMLNETYDSIAELMSEMKKAGIDQKDYSGMMSFGNILGGLTGADGGQTVRDVVDFIKNLNAGTSFDADNTSSRFQNTSVYLADYFNKLEDKNTNGTLSHLENSNYNLIKNYGGATEASKYLLQNMERLVDSQQFSNPALAFFDWNDSANEFVFNKDSYNNFIKSGMDVSQMYEVAQEKLQNLEMSGNQSAILKWRDQSGTYIRNNLEGDQLTGLVQNVLSAYMKQTGQDAQGVLSLMGVTDTNMQNLMVGFLGHKQSNAGLANQVALQSVWQQQTASQLAGAPSLSERFGSWWERTKDGMTQGWVNFDNAAGEWIQNLTDKINGTSTLAPRYDKVYSTTSDMDKVSLEEVQRATKTTNQLIASNQDALYMLANKGYAIDDNLMKYVSHQFDTVDRSVQYSRDVITDWGTVSQDLRQYKDEIMTYAEKNDLSETIVAALQKYNLSAPRDNKVNMSQTVETLGSQMVNYGGNQQLAMAATFAGQSAVDAQLNQMGYNMSSLRSVGAQSVVSNVGLNQLNLGDAMTQKINAIFGQNISNGYGGSTYTSTASAQAFVNSDLRFNSAGVTASDLDAIINAKASSSSLLRGKGEVIFNAATSAGIDPLYALAHMGEESAWGSSNIAKSKNNFLGIGAYDSSPYSSAYSYGSVDQGIVSGINFLSENYINSDRWNQNTLYEMKNGGDGWHQYATNSTWHTNIATIMAEGASIAGKDTIGGSSESGNGVATRKESVNKNASGTNGYSPAFESIQDSTNLQLLDAFNKNASIFYGDGTESILSETSGSQTEARLKNQLMGLYSGGALNKKFAQIGKLGPTPDTMAYESRRIIDAIVDALSSGNYGVGDIDSLLSQTMSKEMSYIEGVFSNSTAYSDYMGQLKSEAVLKHQSINSSNPYEILESFGNTFLGMSLSDFNGDVSSYNKTLMSEASKFYDAKYGQLKQFLGNGGGAWGEMGASDQQITYETLKRLEVALGKDQLGGLMDGRSETDILSQAGRDKLQYLHRDKSGQLYYDPTKANDGSAGLGDLEEWRRQGERTSTLSVISDRLKLGDSGQGLTVDQLGNKAREQVDLVKNQQYETMVKVDGMFNGFKSYLSSPSTKVSESIMSEFKSALKSAVLSGDSASIDNAIKLGEGNGIVLKSDAISEFKNLAKAINDVDIKPLLLAIDGINELGNVAHDIGNTANLIKGAFGEGFSTGLSSEIENLMSRVFKEDDALEKQLGNLSSDELIGLLAGKGTLTDKNGEIKVQISAEDLDVLGQTISTAMDTSLSTMLGDNIGLNQFKNSELYNAAMDKNIVIEYKGEQLTAEEALTTIEELNSKVGTEVEAQKQMLIETTLDAFKEAVTEMGKTSSDSAQSINDVANDLSTHADTFVSTMQKYDDSIGKAIATMNSRINSLGTSNVPSYAASSGSRVW